MKYTTLLAGCLIIFGCNHVKNKVATKDSHPSIFRVYKRPLGWELQTSQGVTYGDFFDTSGNFFRMTSKGEIRIDGDTVTLMKSMLSFMMEYGMKKTVMISDRGDTTRWSVYDTIRLITCKEK